MNIVMYFLLYTFCFLHICYGFSPIDNYLIDAGSATDTVIGQRTFAADTFPSKFLSTTNDVVVNTSAKSLHSPLYQTARVLLQNSTYTFPISQTGRHWIRLYFYPFISEIYNLSTAKFSVSTQNLPLLSRFSPNGTSVKEFSLHVNSRTLVIHFTPLDNSFAFINALEVVSIPDSLFAGNKNAFQTVERVNIGGPTISPDEDSLSRTWVPDNSFLRNPSVVERLSDLNDVAYGPPGTATPDVAPELVYGSATLVKGERTPTSNLNLTWEFTMEAGFHYLIRFHICNIVQTFKGNLPFDVSIDSVKVLTLFTESYNTEGIFKAIPYYKDFLTEPAVSSQLQITIAPSPQNEYYVAFLNGIEIMKIISGRSSSNKGWIAGIVVSAFVLMIATGYLFVYCRRANAEHQLHQPESPTAPLHAEHEMATMGFINSIYECSFDVVRTATDDFDERRVIGRGGFGKVYRGRLDDGTKVAIKRTTIISGQGLAESQNEIDILRQLRNQNIISLIGYCAERNEFFFIYEYMENGTLQSHLYGSGLPSLGWIDRLRICIEAAKGLLYLHENHVIHHDVKSANILLDENFSAKLADFGLSKRVTESNPTYISNDVKGTFGYLDPDYASTGELTKEADVYSLGVVLIEVLCAREVIDNSLGAEKASLPQYAMKKHRRGDIRSVVDKNLRGKISNSSLNKFVETAKKCMAESGVNRPSMAEVVSDLEEALELQNDKSGSSLCYRS